MTRAISTAGGISFDAIDERFMLRAWPGVFVAGEMLDWEAPTGGYLLLVRLETMRPRAREQRGGQFGWKNRQDGVGRGGWLCHEVLVAA